MNILFMSGEFGTGEQMSEFTDDATAVTHLSFEHLKRTLAQSQVAGQNK